MRWLIILLLTGCGSYQTLEQQYDEATACQENCDALWGSYHKRDIYQAKKAEPICKNRMVMITDQRRYPSRLGNHYDCVTRQEAYLILQSLGRSRL